VTGAHNDRRELLKMLKGLAPGDVVTVTRIDRPARSTFDLFAIVKQIVDAKAQFRSLAEPWADTGTSTGRLMLAVFGGLGDVERDLIRTRTAEGRSRAQPRLVGDGQRARHLPNSRVATTWQEHDFAVGVKQ
jgi:DNA invertase Pin-like site-specific DNA recombinase